ncbi:MAG TPA: LLM class flavin-dependent oxidoreductase [Candidatus Binataceae bacterium]|nr:LLM class flavin-dependent oxidoreductase [Candidatus Binataceae bacterium]
MPAGRIPCGIAIPQMLVSAEARFLRDFLARAEALGYDSVWVQEQILGDAPMLEPVTLLTFAAALTSKVRLGTSVILPLTRHPIHLAKALASLDQLSDGRLILGVGIGGPHVPEAPFGIPKENRARRFVEGIRVLKALWTEPRASFAGDFWKFENLAMEPKPLQKPHPPIWFGARDEIALKRTVRLGDGWMGAGSSSTADFIKQSAMLRRLLEEAGRDPAKFPVSKRVYLAIDDNRERAEQRLRAWFGERYKNADMASRVSIWGGVAECVDKLGELVRAGAQHFLLNPVFDDIEHLEKLASDVMPQL